jgi:hypothetical protein
VDHYPAAACLLRGSTPPPKLDQSKGAAKAFEPIGAPLTGPGFVLVPMAVAFLRIHTLELTSGIPKAVASGFDFRAV